MNKKVTLSILLVSTVLFVQSCGDDESSPADVLVTSNRSTGVFYKLDKSTGETTEIFTPTIGGNSLKEIRAFVYHKGEDLFYASANSETYPAGVQAGYLYSMNPDSKVATIINDNDGNGGEYAVWDAINNWAVAEDDSLIAIGDFNSDAGDGIVKFGTDGGRSPWSIEVDICCGMGLLYEKSSGVMLVGSSWDSDDGEVIIETVTSEGEITNTTTITTLTDFPDDLTVTWLNLKAMAKDSKGNIYGILFHYDLGKSYFVKIDIEGEEVTYLSTLGLNYENQFNTLAFIPAKYAD